MNAILNFVNVYPDLADPRTKNWFLMSSPWPTYLIIYLYIKFVYDWGPKWMERRPPYRIDRIVQIYDIIQIIANSYIFHQIVTAGWLHYNWRCEPVDYSWNPRALQVARTVHLYFITKVADLLDTVFFVLRKKQNQVTFLHVYHHATMVASVWVATRFFPGGHGTFMGVINSFVHVAMYLHYFVMSLKLWKPWWKKYLTQLQLIQFGMVLYHFNQLWWVEDCGYPKWTGLLYVPQNIMFIWMFSKFYIESYLKSKNKTDQDSGVSKIKLKKNCD